MTSIKSIKYELKREQRRRPASKVSSQLCALQLQSALIPSACPASRSFLRGTSGIPTFSRSESCNFREKRFQDQRTMNEADLKHEPPTPRSQFTSSELKHAETASCVPVNPLLPYPTPDSLYNYKNEQPTSLQHLAWR